LAAAVLPTNATSATRTPPLKKPFIATSDKQILVTAAEATPGLTIAPKTECPSGETTKSDQKSNQGCKGVAQTQQLEANFLYTISILDITRLVVQILYKTIEASRTGMMGDLRMRAMKPLPLTVAMVVFSATLATSQDQVPVETLVRSMVELKRVSDTCESFVQGSPKSQLMEIDAYFAKLNQPIPEPEDPDTKADIGKLIKQHAAYICSQKLNRAQRDYYVAAAAYMEKKPEQWPAAPMVQFPQWCQDPSCGEYR
jgi:hypothetical protein